MSVGNGDQVLLLLVALRCCVQGEGEVEAELLCCCFGAQPPPFPPQLRFKFNIEFKFAEAGVASLISASGEIPCLTSRARNLLFSSTTFRAAA